MRTLEGKLLLVECLEKGKICSRKNSCQSVKAWTKIQDLLEEAINSITLNNLQ